jgi:hypothetical protein
MLRAAAALEASATTPGPVHQHGFSDLDALSALAQLDDGAGDFVPESEGELVVDGPGRPVHEVQIRVAKPGPGDPEEDLAWARNRFGNVPEFRRLFPCDELHGLHG